MDFGNLFLVEIFRLEFLCKNFVFEFKKIIVCYKINDDFSIYWKK